jgi:hypothetical protein
MFEVVNFPIISFNLYTGSYQYRITHQCTFVSPLAAASCSGESFSRPCALTLAPTLRRALATSIWSRLHASCKAVHPTTKYRHSETISQIVMTQQVAHM